MRNHMEHTAIAIKKLNEKKNIIIPPIMINAPDFKIGKQNVFSPNVKILSEGGPIIIGNGITNT